MLRWRFKRDLALGLSFLCLSAVALNSNFAVAVDGDVEVEVGILPVLTITTPTKVRIVLEPGGPASVAEMPVYIGTNNQSGLHAAVSLDRVSNGGDDTILRSLVNEYDSNYYLAPLEESIVNINDFPFDHWGCTFQDDMRYESLNTSDNPSIHYLTHNPSANEKRYFLCAARASKFQVAGLYNNTIMMTAVPNVLPDTITSITYMQEINETVIASMETDQSYQLVDGRDKKIYWVTKLQDGRVWMTQNLDYDLEAKTDGSQLAEWGSLYPDDAEADLVSEKSKLYKDGGNLVYDTGTDSYIDSSSLAFNSEKRHYHIGSFYNIEASAREKDGSNSVIYADASGICPFSWTVPNGQSSWAMYPSDILSNLVSLYGANAASSLYLAPMGYISSDGALSGVGTSSYYLGNSRSGSDYYNSRGVLAVNSSYGVSLGSLSDTQGGFIRCVAVPGRRYIVTYKNATNNVVLDGGVIPEFEQATLPGDVNVVSYDTKYSLNTNGLEPGNIPEGYTFLGWTTDEFTRSKANVSGLFNLGATQEVIRASDEGSNEVELSIFPAWEYNYNEPVLSIEASEETRSIDDIDYMQEITPDIVSNTPYNEIKQLIDSRDNRKYWVRKLGDGNLWMEQNLDLSFDEPRILTSNDSNVTSSRTLSNEDDNVSQQHLSGGKNVSDEDLRLSTSDSLIWRNAYGSSYNRYTILAGSDNSFNDIGDYSESICPSGWQLPSANNTSNTFYRDNYYEETNYSFTGIRLATSTPPNDWSTSETHSGIYDILPGKKISRTQNVSDAGVRQSSYSDNWSNNNIRGTDRETASSQAHVLSIPGATELRISLYHAGEGCCDFVRIYPGSHPEYDGNNTYNGIIYGGSDALNSYSTSYTINGNTISNVGLNEIVVPGDTVTFTFRSDGSVQGSGYGYYAIVTGYGEKPIIENDPLLSFDSFIQSQYNFTKSELGVRCVAASREKTAEKTLRHISTMQEMKPSICSATPVGTEVQLRDTRDNQTYFVRKMSDGNCWMVQNLAYGKIRSTGIDSLSSDLLDKMNVGYSVTESATSPGHLQPAIDKSDDVVTIEYGYPFARIDDIPMNSHFRKFYSGIYYNYAAAAPALNASGSICPRGWRLPTASDSVIPDENFSQEELKAIYTDEGVTDYNGVVYLTSTTDEENHSIKLSDGSLVDYDDTNYYPVRCLAK